MKQTMASLGKEAVDAIKRVLRISWTPDYYVNKTTKYVSIKILVENLTPQQIKRVEEILQKNPRFLKVHNGTAELPTRAPWHGAGLTGPKVMVRFSQ
jgi:hypothetical protein